ncbi:MAG: hypothetical protein IJH32_03795 [Ruminococcus sp.]|nr:hypothetical protein [Ruminococcus sp.]
MRKILALLMCFMLVVLTLSACTAAASDELSATRDSVSTRSEATPSEAIKTEEPTEASTIYTASAETDSNTEQTVAASQALPAEDSPVFDPYAIENNYDIGSDILEKHSDTDYGKIIENYEYDSDAAGDKKYCNILLPPGYGDDEEYPVMYVIHGWDGSHTDQIEPDSYLQLVYGNMLKQGLTVPMIIVNVDMYTDKLSDKDSKTDEELRYIYDKVWDDIIYDLMPEIEEAFYVKTGRENTALAGVSHGGTEALMTYFQHPEKFGYVASYAADPGVIPTDFYEEEYLNEAIFDKFPVPQIQPYYLYMAVGTNDEYGIDVTVAYRDAFNKEGIKNQTDVVEGYEHDFYFWRLCFYNFLNKIFKAC